MGASNIPLPALAVQSQQQPSVLAQYAQVMGIRGEQQDQQLRNVQLQQAQLQLHDQQTMRQVLSDPNIDWNSPDSFNTVLSKAAQSGVSPQTLMGLRNSNVEYMKNFTAMSAQQQDMHIKNLDQTRGELMSIVNDPNYSSPDNQAKYQSILQRHVQAGDIKPGQFPDQLPPKEALVPTVNSLALGSTLAKEAAEMTTANARKSTADTEAAKFSASQNPSSPLYAPTQPAIALGNAPGAAQIQQNEVSQAGRTAGAQAAARLPYETALESNKIKLQQQAYPAAIQGVAPHLVTPATNDYTKASNDYADTLNAAEDMNTFINMARSGNKLAYSYAPTEGVLTFNTARGVKRVNMAEIGSYGGAGSALDRLKGFFGKQTSGASISPDVLNDMQALHSQVTQNANDLYGRKIQVINSAYGSKFQPQQFTSNSGNAGSGNAPPPQSGFVRIQASDGSVHDIPQNNMGAARQRDPGLKVVGQ